MLLHRPIPLGLAVILLAGCSSAAPPPVAPAPEPEPEEVAAAPQAPSVPQIPIEERIRAPFAVLSDGRPAPREARTGVVVLEQTQDRTPVATARDTAAPDPAPRPAQAAAPAPAGTPAATTAAAPRPTTPAAGSTATPAPRAPAPREHTVEAGETFFAVARRYEVTASALAAVNPGVDADRLRPGQVLQLPAYATRAAGAGTTPSAPATPSRPATPPPAQQQPTQQRTHTVASGETLWSIARRYDVTPEQIRRANRMNDDVVRLGQRLVIP